MRHAWIAQQEAMLRQHHGLQGALLSPHGPFGHAQWRHSRLTIRVVETSNAASLGVRFHTKPTMSPSLSIDHQAVAAFCRRHHITRLALFGSALRDDFQADSDVDVVVEFEPGHVPGLKFVSMERELSGLFGGRRVDMVTPKFLNSRIRDHVLSSAEPLYVAA
jgi:predicted nucleotidyltransferase